MAGKKEFRITTPRGSVFTVTGKNGSTTARLEWAPGFAQKKAEGFSRAQAFVDSECLRYMNPLTPRRTGMLIKSWTLGTVIGSGSIEYLAPYARRQYYEHKYDKYVLNQNTTQQFPHPQPQPSGNRQQRRNYQKQYGRGKHTNAGR